jgi:hypothetical protein
MAFAAMRQTPWGCRWSRLTEPGPCGIKYSKTSSYWVCVRPTLHLSSRLVRPGDCAACPYWESIEFGRIANATKIDSAERSSYVALRSGDFRSRSSRLATGRKPHSLDDSYQADA